MAIVKAVVPQAHLATAMGNPNELLVEYSTEVLLPVPGPYLFMQVRRSFLQALIQLNDFLAFVEDYLHHRSTGGVLPWGDVRSLHPLQVGLRDTSRYGRQILLPARAALASLAESKVDLRRVSALKRRNDASLTISLLERLAMPNRVFRFLFEAGLLVKPPTILDPKLANLKSFRDRCQLVLQHLLKPHAKRAPKRTPALQELALQALETAEAKYTGFLKDDFATLTAATRALLVDWFATYQQLVHPVVPAPFAVDLSVLLGFPASFLSREWALTRKERLRLAFGTPNLRGPLGAESVAPQGFFRKEEYLASANERILQRAESVRSTTTEGIQLSTAELRRNLDALYYSGAGTVNQLTQQGANVLLQEERRQSVLSMIRQVSESRENLSVDAVRQVSSTTVIHEARGVDPRLTSTHHRFKVAVPIQATAEMYDAGLTWSPRISNPFLMLRQAVYHAYDSAYHSYLRQYYVPEPVGPTIVWDRYTVSTDKNIEVANDNLVTEDFHITLPPGGSEERPDLAHCTVTWNQSESIWNDDPDHFTARLRDLSFSGGVVRGTVRLETDDDNSDWQGFAHIEVPVLRYSEETVNALAQHELAMQDYELKRQALEAQAHQYARIKEREFIERHEDRAPLLKLVFDALIRKICRPVLLQQVSYYGEIVSRCVDWTRAKISMEPVAMNALAYPDFEANHFINSTWVRLFLPIPKACEQNLQDVFAAFGTAQAQNSLAQAIARVDAIRARLAQNGPDALDAFSTELIIGEHVEGVMSDHELGT